MMTARFPNCPRGTALRDGSAFGTQSCWKIGAALVPFLLLRENLQAAGFCLSLC